MVRTRLCRLLHIEKPMIQGGMAWISTPELVAAVSEAGGLGVLTSVTENIDTLRNNIRQVKTRTSKPFGVNVLLQTSYTDDVARVLLEERVPIVTTGAGSPEKYMEDWLHAGIQVMPVVPSVSYARRMESLGAAAVIAEGTEAGGHVGDITTLCLLPQVVDSVSVPVIAAGGIGNGRGLAAMLLLGAQGVQMGTVFLTAQECRISPAYKRRILDSGDTGTMVIGRRFSHPVRTLKSPYANRLARWEREPNITEAEFLHVASGALQRAVVEGNEEDGNFMAGQVAGMLHRERTVKEILTDLEREADRLLLPTQKIDNGEG